MKEISLGYKARDLHELACHFVAESAGLYTDRGLRVTLRDTRLVPDETLPADIFSVACGAAAVRWLHGEDVKVVFAATARPMFWLLSHESIRQIEDLQEKHIASYPDSAPPAQFLRIVLEDAGLNPHRDVIFDAAPDDSSRLEMLRSGRAAAALVSSATLSNRVQSAGFRNLLCLGDRFRLPTTGLAVGGNMLENERETVEAVRDCFCASLQLIHTQSGVLQRALSEARLVPAPELKRAAELARRHFTTDGRIDTADALPGIRRLAQALGCPLPATADSLYALAYRPR